MTKPRLEKDFWVLVADGGRALVLRNEGDEVYPNLQVVQKYEIENPPTRDQGTDKPGRTNDAFGNTASVGQTDWHQQAEDRFMQTLASDLAKKHEEGAFKSLIVAAPPTALGALRKAESANLKKAIVADIHKDWTHMPVYEIEQAVTKALSE
jgi:protein required for attachment to host cells